MWFDCWCFGYSNPHPERRLNSLPLLNLLRLPPSPRWSSLDHFPLWLIVRRLDSTCRRIWVAKNCGRLVCKFYRIGSQLFEFFFAFGLLGCVKNSVKLQTIDENAYVAFFVENNIKPRHTFQLIRYLG